MTLSLSGADRTVRIEVGDVFDDVYRIDVLATTVWESGGPGKAVGGSQPTGALVTFPNREILRSNIINYSRDFPYVWDEVTFAVANESDLDYTIAVLRNAADAVDASLSDTRGQKSISGMVAQRIRRMCSQTTRV